MTHGANEQIVELVSTIVETDHTAIMESDNFLAVDYQLRRVYPRFCLPTGPPCENPEIVWAFEDVTRYWRSVLGLLHEYLHSVLALCLICLSQNRVKRFFELVSGVDISDRASHDKFHPFQRIFC